MPIKRSDSQITHFPHVWHGFRGRIGSGIVVVEANTNGLINVQTASDDACWVRWMN